LVARRRVSKIVLEIMESASKSWESQRNGCDKAETPGSKIYHVVNPKAIFWSTIVPWVIQSYKKAPHMRIVPFNEWVAALKHSLDSAKINLDQNPAVRLLGFYQQIEKSHETPRRLLSYNAEQASTTLREMEQVNPDWVRSWMRQWGCD